MYLQSKSDACSPSTTFTAVIGQLIDEFQIKSRIVINLNYKIFYRSKTGTFTS